MKGILLSILFFIISISIGAQVTGDTELFYLDISEVCQGEGLTKLGGRLADSTELRLPEGGIFKIASCLMQPCTDAIIYDPLTDDYYFDANAPEDSYIIEYQVGAPPFGKTYIAQFDIQAANSQLIVLGNSICEDQILFLQANPIGGQLTGLGLDSIIYESGKSYFFNSEGLTLDSSYIMKYQYSLQGASGLVCRDSSQVEIQLHSNPQVHFEIDSITECESIEIPITMVVDSEASDYNVIWYNENLDSIYNERHFITDTISKSSDFYAYVQDANGCSDLEAYRVSILNPPIIECKLTSTINCYGYSDGELTIDVLGPVDDFNFLWMDGDTNSFRMNLSAREYSATVTDSNGCETSCSLTIEEPDPIVVECKDKVLAPSCSNTIDGQNLIAISGGTGPYAISLDSLLFVDNLSLDELGSGSYRVYIKDSNGCASQCDFVVPEVQEETCELFIERVISCQGFSDGSIRSITSIDAEEAIYMWNTSDNSIQIADLPAGLYELTVTNALGCSASCSIELEEPKELEMSLVANNPSCYLSDTGSIQAEVSGGTLPYHYSLDNLQYQSISSFDNLPSGSYEIFVEDFLGCVLVSSINIDEPDDILAEVQKEDQLSCFGDRTGYVNLSSINQPVSIEWSTGSSSNMVSELYSGSYTVTLTNEKGCEKVYAFEITEPEQLSLEGEILHNNCFGDNKGLIETKVLGGVEPYVYSWSNGASEANIDSLAEGIYSLTISDANGCELNASYEIETPDDIIASFKVESPTCFGNTNGVAAITIAEPGEYSFLWNTGSNSSQISISAGTYKVLVTNENSCSKYFEIMVTEPDSLTLLVDTFVPLACVGTSTAEFHLAASGGTPPYTLEWSDGSFGFERRDMAAGSYEVSLTDVIGCTTLETLIVDVPEDIDFSYESDSPSCNGLADGRISVISDYDLANVDIIWSHGAEDVFLDGLIAGTYDAIITTAEGCKKNISVTLTEPDSLKISDSRLTGVTCYGAATGEIEIKVVGGTAPYNFNWDNGSTQSQLTDLPANSYLLTLTDAQGCELHKTYELTENSEFKLEPLNITACVDEPMVLKAKLTGRDYKEVDFSWEIENVSSFPSNGLDVSKEDNNTLVFNTFDIKPSIIKVVNQAVDSLGCIAEAVHTLNLEACFDLALIKEVVGSELRDRNEPVIFSISVVNQGSVTAYNLVVEDRPDADLIFHTEKNKAAVTGNPYDWEESGQGLTTRIDSLIPSEVLELFIYFRISDSTEALSLHNEAEIINYSSAYRVLPFDEDDVLSDNPEEKDDDIADEVDGTEDNPDDDDQKDGARVSICYAYDHKVEMALCGAPEDFSFDSEYTLKEIDPEGDGDGDDSDGDVGNIILGLYESEALALGKNNPGLPTMETQNLLFAKLMTKTGCISIIPVELEFVPLPTDIELEEKVVVRVGQSITLSVPDRVNSEYQWQQRIGNSFVDIPGALSSDYVIPAITMANDYEEYRVIVTDVNALVICAVTSGSSLLRVLPERLACKGKLNVSLNADCGLELAPSQLLSTEVIEAENYKITYLTIGNEQINLSEISNYLGVDIKYEVVNKLNNHNCWGYLHILDGIAPTLSCPEDLTVHCEKGLDINSLRFGLDDNCSGSEVIIESVTVQERCYTIANASYVGTQRIVAKARDLFGNESAACTTEVHLKGMNSAHLFFPGNRVLKGTSWDKNGTAYPEPEESGVIRTFHGDLDSELQTACQIVYTYEDRVVASCASEYHLIRKWTVVNWCTLEIIERQQIIQVVNGPLVTSLHRDTTLVGSGQDCVASFSAKELFSIFGTKEDVELKLRYSSLNPIDSTYSLVQSYGQDTMPELQLEKGQYLVSTEFTDACQKTTLAELVIKIDSCGGQQRRLNIIDKEEKQALEKLDNRENGEEKISEINIYPNPFSDQLFLEVYSDRYQDCTLDLYTLSGYNVLTNKLSLKPGQQKIELNESNFLRRSGIYMVVLVGETIKYSEKLVKR